MKFSQRFLFGSLIVVALAFVGYALLDGRVKAKEAEASADASGDGGQESDAANLQRAMGDKETPILVEAEPVIRGDLVQRVSAQGRVHGYQRVEVKNEVAGRLDALKVRDGRRVEKGDVIAELDDRDYALAVDEAKSNVLAAKADYLTYDVEARPEAANARSSIDARRDALKQRLDAKEISAEDFRQKTFLLDLEELKSGSRRGEVVAARTLDQARVALSRAELNLAKCRVLAPFSGTVFDVSVAQGEYLTSQSKIALLVNLNNLVVKAKVLESEVGTIEPGRGVSIEFTALPDLGMLPGTVEAISPVVNVDDKTVDVIVRFDNNSGRVKPGMFADVTIDSRIHEDRLMVPKTAILPRDDRLVVFKISENNRAKWEYVSTGVENDAYVEITRGNLSEGDMVLTNNHFTMGHDTLVKVANTKK